MTIRITGPRVLRVGMVVAALVAATSCSGDASAETKTCKLLDQFETVSNRLDDPAVFDRDAQGLEAILTERRAILRKLEASVDGGLHDLLRQQNDDGIVIDDALVRSWDVDRERLRFAGQDWMREATGPVVRDVHGREVNVAQAGAIASRTHEQIVVKCRAPELAAGLQEDRSGASPPAGLIEFHRPDASNPSAGDYGNSDGGARFAVESTDGAERALPNPGPWTWVATPDLAPSGDRVVVRASAGTRHSILILDANGDLLQTLYDGPTLYACPTWEPDGEGVIALVDDLHDSLRKLHRFGLDGSDVTLELPFAYEGCAGFLSPTKLVVEDATLDTRDPPAIWTVGVDGSNPTRLLSTDWCNTLLGGVDPTRTAAALTFRCRDPLQDGLWTVDFRTGETQHLVTALVAVPKWSPDGDWLVFGATPLGGDSLKTPGIWIVRADGTGLRQVAAPVASFPIWFPAH